MPGRRTSPAGVRGGRGSESAAGVPKPRRRGGEDDPGRWRRWASRSRSRRPARRCAGCRCSGGEKALVALAFVFAVFLARPSPFYILDEVEAALDDANIDRFLQLVRRFAGRAQFVIVTHQKRTMDAADVLYGVSMGEGGVTKVISRRMPPQDEPDAWPRRRQAGGRRSADARR